MEKLGDCRFLFNRKFARSKRLFRIVIAITICAALAYVTLYHIIVGSRIQRSVESRSGGGFAPLNGSRETKEKRLPHALIIGARKSGTRALLRFLELNPAIKPAHREVHFFDRDTNYQLGLEWYRSQMPETSSDEITVEKSPAYFVTRTAPERIKAMNASVKLVVILRNPVTRLISDFSQMVANRLDGPPSLDDYSELNDPTSPVANLPSPPQRTANATVVWSQAKKEFQSHILRPDGGVDERRRIVRIGMYSVYLERWLASFPRDQFHFVDGEKIITKPHEEMQKLERFLGLTPPVIEENHFVFSSKKGFYCLANRTNASGQNKEESANGAQEPTCLGKTKGRRHVAVDEWLIEQLSNFYAPYNEYLESMTGLSF